MQSRIMKTLQILIIKLLLVFYLIFFTSSLSLNNNNNDVEASGVDLANSEWIPVSNSEENHLRSFNQFEEKINSLINSNMERFEKNLKITLEDLVDEKINLNDKKTISVQEMICSDNKLPGNCHELKECSNNHVYNLMIPKFSDKPFPAVCDLKTLDGGWTLIQRRQDGSENFYRNWTDYVQGFGNLNGEFFIGLEKLHALTTQDKPQELYIILEDFEGTRKYAKYKTFKIESEIMEYKLNVGDYTGDAGDSFGAHNGFKFSTRDRDNDDSDTNCAERKKGGWWYHNCFHCNLNGRYLLGSLRQSKIGQGMSWGNFRGYNYSLKFVQMMIRPKD